MANKPIVDAMWDDSPIDVSTEVNFIWSIANKLRGPYRSDKYMLRKLAIILLLLTTLSLSGCAQKLDGDGMVNSYTQISQEQAKEMMARDDGHVVVDVRRQDEYDAGHIPSAILIPNESIGTEPPQELPDLDQIILIYCRSGNRSKQAAQKLLIWAIRTSTSSAASSTGLAKS